MGGWRGRGGWRDKAVDGGEAERGGVRRLSRCEGKVILRTCTIWLYVTVSVVAQLKT